MFEKKPASSLKIFRRVLIIVGVIAVIILAHFFILFFLPFIMEIHGS